MKIALRLVAAGVLGLIITAPAAPAVAAGGLLGGGGLLGTGIGTPSGALGTGLLSGGGSGGGTTGGGTLGSGGGVLGTGIGAPSGALGTGILSSTPQTGPVTASINPNSVNANALGLNGNLLFDLFGPSGPSGRVALAGGVLGGDGLVLDLFGSGNGGNGGGGNGGGGNGGGGGSGSGGDGGLFGPGGIQVASLEAGTKGYCFAPDAAQIAKLVNRHSYGAATFASWAGARTIKVVSVRLCPASLPKIASQRNINRLQSFISTQASLAGRLQGHSASQVIGVDRTGDALVVYVM